MSPLALERANIGARTEVVNTRPVADVGHCHSTIHEQRRGREAQVAAFRIHQLAVRHCDEVGTRVGMSALRGRGAVGVYVATIGTFSYAGEFDTRLARVGCAEIVEVFVPAIARLGDNGFARHANDVVAQVEEWHGGTRLPRPHNAVRWRPIALV